ncbi:MAG: hypothetical protein HQM13_20520, partial [SAR324 cluster bacterium]|nr:hypothetical protein [SAR324 cluster bacterium]
MIFDRLFKLTLTGIFCALFFFQSDLLAEDLSPFLAETQEIVFSSSRATPLRNKAADLKTPVKIYEWVRNNYRPVFYPGSLMTSIYAFHSKRGTEVDLASLLIAMLRSQNIPARYLHLPAQMPSLLFANLTGVKDVEVAKSIWWRIGYSYDEPQEKIGLSRILVEILVPQADLGSGSSGVNCVDTPEQCVWLPVDPFYKEYDMSGKIYIDDKVDFDIESFLRARQNKDETQIRKNPLRIFEEQILSYLETHHPDKNLDDTDYHGPIVPEIRDNLAHAVDHFSWLPTDYFYRRHYASVKEHDADINSWYHWPWRVHLTVNLHKRLPDGSKDLSVSLFVDQKIPISDYVTKGLALTYSSCGTSCLKIKLLLGGEEWRNVTVSDGKVRWGDKLVLEVGMDFREEIYSSLHNALVVGEHFQINVGGPHSSWWQVKLAIESLKSALLEYPVATSSAFPDAPFLDTNHNGEKESNEAFLAENRRALETLQERILRLSGWLIHNKEQEMMERLQGLRHIVQPTDRSIQNAASVHHLLYVDGVPVSATPEGYVYNIYSGAASRPRYYDSAALPSNPPPGRAGIRSGDIGLYMMSTFEHEIWQELTGYEAFSAALGIQQALEEGAELLNVYRQGNHETLTAAYPHLGMTRTPPAVFGLSSLNERDIFGSKITSWPIADDQSGKYVILDWKINQASPSHRREFFPYSSWIDQSLFWFDRDENLLKQMIADDPACYIPPPGWWFGRHASGSCQSVLNVLEDVFNEYHQGWWEYKFFDKNSGFDLNNLLYHKLDPNRHSMEFIKGVRHHLFRNSDEDIGMIFPSKPVKFMGKRVYPMVLSEHSAEEQFDFSKLYAGGMIISGDSFMAGGGIVKPDKKITQDYLEPPHDGNLVHFTQSNEHVPAGILDLEWNQFPPYTGFDGKHTIDEHLSLFEQQLGGSSVPDSLIAMQRLPSDSKPEGQLTIWARGVTFDTLVNHIFPESHAKFGYQELITPNPHFPIWFYFLNFSGPETLLMPLPHPAFGEGSPPFLQREQLLSESQISSDNKSLTASLNNYDWTVIENFFSEPIAPEDLQFTSVSAPDTPLAFPSDLFVWQLQEGIWKFWNPLATIDPDKKLETIDPYQDIWIYYGSSSEELLAYLALPVEPVNDPIPENSGALNVSIGQGGPVGLGRGVHQVLPDGTFSYSLPIQIVPGTNGAAPNLSLTYNSASKNGVLGMGWSLTGLPSITRIADSSNSINYSGNDTYTGPDGVLVDISDGQKSEYHSQQESWGKYVPEGICGEGPCSWTLYRPDGSRLFFGRSTGDNGSRIIAPNKNGAVRVWALDQFEDAFGNYYTVNYVHGDSGDFYPESIVYTLGNGLGTGEGSKYRKISFVTESRDDQTPRQEHGVSIVMKKRLKRITIQSLGKSVRDYEIGYKYSSSTQRSLLISLQEKNGTESFPPYKFAWADDRIHSMETDLGGGLLLESVKAEVKTGCGPYDKAGINAICVDDTEFDHFLTTRITQNRNTSANSSQQTYSTRYHYENGKFDSAVEAQRELWFEKVFQVQEESKKETKAFYRQDPGYEGKMSRVEHYAHGKKISEIQNTFVPHTASHPDVRLVLHKAQQKFTFDEAGALIFYTLQTVTSFNSFGFPEETSNCAWVGTRVCLKIVRRYKNSVTPTRIQLGALAEIKKTDGNHILEWSRFEYSSIPFKLAKVQHYLCPDRTECIEGVGTWQVTGQNYVYDVSGNKLSEQDEFGYSSSAEFDETLRTFVTSRTNGGGHKIRHLHDHAGRVIQKTDARGQALFYDYDGLGRISQISNSSDQKINYFYQDYGLANAQVTKVAMSNPDGLDFVQESFFDGLGFVYKEIRTEDSDSIVVEHHENFKEGLKTTNTSQPRLIGSMNPQWITSSYDFAGRLASVERPLGGRSEYRYGKENALRSVERKIISRTDEGEKHASTASYFDAWGNLIKVKDHNNEMVTYKYNLLQDLIAVQLPTISNPISIFYDTRGRKTKIVDPSTGITSYHHSAGSNSKTVTTPAGSLNYTYDALNRVTAKQFNGSSISYTYDETAEATGYLSKISEPVSWACGDIQCGNNESFEYDEVGNVIKKTSKIEWWDDEKNDFEIKVFEEKWQYDPLNRLRFTVLPDGTKIDYSYNPRGLLEDVHVNGIHFARFSDYNTKGQFQKKEIFSNDRIISTYVYDGENRLIELRTTSASGIVLQDLHYYYYHEDGTIRWIDDQRLDKTFRGVNTDQTQIFEYDDLFRLKQATGVYGNRSYQYDPLGNLTSMAMGPDPQIAETRKSFTYDQQSNQLKSVHGEDYLQRAFNLSEVTYTDSGNLKTKTLNGETWEYTYDFENRLIKVERSGTPDEGLSVGYDWNRVSFQYNDSGQRTRKQIVREDNSRVDTFYVSQSYELHRDSRNNKDLVTIYIHAHGQKLASITKYRHSGSAPKRLDGDTQAGTALGTFFYHINHLDSSSLITDKTGKQIAHITYLPFGQIDVTHSAGLNTVTHKFTGQEYDEETGLAYYNFRFYDPTLGRFL